MKKDFFEELKDKIKKIQNKKMDTNGDNMGYIRMTENGEQLVSKDQIIQEVMKEIRDLIKVNKQVIPSCEITDEEWNLFLEIAYKYFNEYQLNSGFRHLVMTGIRYVMFNGFINNQKTITMQTLLENFEIPMLPYGLGDGISEGIRKNVYMATRKDNIVDLREYRKVSKR